jgi:tetratricopeptide (TPR) repeat protein
VLALLIEAAPLMAQTGGLTGKARDENGNPLAGYQILIERQDIRGTYRVKTNKKGEYIYIGLPIGNYKVTLQNPAGQALVFLNTRIGLGDPTTLDFDLAKEKEFAAEAQKKAIEEDPELKRKMEQQAKETKEFTGLKELFEQGQALYAQKQYADAAAVFERALPLAKEKNVPVVLERMADSYHKARQYDKAVAYYHKAIEASPSQASYYNNLGNVYAEMGKVQEAAAQFQKAAEINPSEASRYYFNYGAVMYNTGKMDESSEAFKKATEIDPGFADAYFWLGQALMGKATLADDGSIVPAPGTAEALEKYLELAPDGRNATTAQQLLQTIEAGVETRYKREKKKKRG